MCRPFVMDTLLPLLPRSVCLPTTACQNRRPQLDGTAPRLRLLFVKGVRIWLSL